MTKVSEDGVYTTALQNGCAKALKEYARGTNFNDVF